MNTSENKSSIRDLYRELILRHAKAPQNFRFLKGATHTATGINPLCGDKLHVYAAVNDQATITDLSFEGSGCAISMASASLLTETIRELDVDEANTFSLDVVAHLKDKNHERPGIAPIWGKLRALEGVRQHPSRVKCATLAWQTLHAALNQTTNVATTE